MAPNIFTALTPRKDVLSGALSDAIFAASLDEVVTGTAPAAYGEADLFFAATWPSLGLKALLNEALGRVSGARPDAAPVIRLETNLGGGKTHNLIALWHAARGQLDPMRAMEFMNPEHVPNEPVPQMAVFVGTSAGATTFPEIGGIEASTLWEYFALQIGGPEAWNEYRTDDLTAPGAAAIKRLLGDKPTLILIDEIARYLATAAGRPVGDSNLARQTVSFLMALMEAVDNKASASLVLTTTEVTDAFGEYTQEVLDAITEAGELVARREHVIRPSGEADLPFILSRRLFEDVPAGAAEAVGRAYGEAAEKAFAHGADLPEDVHGTGWSAAVTVAYPWHPHLIRVLDKRLATIPNFQRTRGALRLLAGAVRRLWEQSEDRPLLIHPHHLDLSDRHTVEDLSSRLQLGAFEPVIRADIATEPGGAPSHAEEVDERLGVPYARRLAVTIYLYSLTNDVPGIPAPALLGAVLAPGDDPNLLARSLDALEHACWYLHVDDRGYRFATEPSLVKLIQDSQSRIAIGKVRTEATRILAEIYRDAALKVRRSWEDARVPDREDEAALVVLHWDDFGDQRGVDPTGEIPARIQEVWEKTPAGGLRQYRNRLVLLAPSIGTHDPMLDTVRRHLALTALAHDPETLKALSEDKRRELQQFAQESELTARVAVCNHVNVLYVPQKTGLEAVELGSLTQASLKRNQTDAILDRLAAMDKTLAAGDPPLDPQLVKTRLGAMLADNANPLSTAGLVRAFAQRSDLKLVLDRMQIVNLVRTGVRNGVWEYHDITRGDAGWATQDRPPVDIRLGDDTLLYTPGAAPQPTIEPCPLCGEVHSGSCASKKPLARAEFKGSGSATAAFGGAMAGVVEAGNRVSGLRAEIAEIGDGAHQQLARLHSLIPPTARNTTIRYRVDLSLAFGVPTDTIVLHFDAPAGEWAALKSAVDQVLRSRPAELRAFVDATFDPPLELDSEELAAISQRAADTGPGKCTIALRAEEPA
jgi:hypothetical protein